MYNKIIADKETIPVSKNMFSIILELASDQALEDYYAQLLEEQDSIGEDAPPYLKIAIDLTDKVIQERKNQGDDERFIKNL